MTLEFVNSYKEKEKRLGAFHSFPTQLFIVV